MSQVIYARICAQNFEAVLAMIVKLAGDAIFDIFWSEYIKTHSKTPTKYTYYSLGLRAGGWGGGIGMGDWEDWNMLNSVN